MLRQTLYKGGGKHIKALRGTTGILVIIGALNWGLVALAQFDLVAAIFGMEFGETNGLTRVVYGLVGLSAIYQVADRVGGREVSTVSSAHSTV
jgi:uncharacterized membrane protein YuzA (DUF378 family)